MELKGQVAIVTGGASGLGEATARAIIGAGGKVVIADKNRERGAALEAELGGALKFAEADVSSEADMTRAVEMAASLGTLRLAVGCAGVGWAKRTLSKEGEPHDLALFETVIRINLVGTFNLLRLAAARMAKNEPGPDGERGLIVNTASVAAYDGQIGQVAYAASKGGVVGLTLPAARDLSASGIRVCAIAPGTFDTPMLASLPEKVREALAAGIPFPSRLGAPSEYAALVLHMASNRYLNGEVIRLDGSLRMPPK
jgi:NAD(P)-dependent dehydrogenase (short-subunit alcohol dehydrogenase family)